MARPLSQNEENSDFDAAVDRKVNEKMAALKDEILASLKGEKTASASDDGDMKFASALALAIAQLGEQGIGKQKAIDPAVIKARDDARKAMMAAIIDAHAAGKVPAYELTRKVYLDEVLVDPIWVNSNHEHRPTVIEWPGVPNESMTPINEVAKEIFGYFKASIGNVEIPVHEQPVRVTAGGLVVHGAPSPTRANIHRAPIAEKFGEGLKIAHKDRPGQYVEKHILGTVAKPAQQTI